MVGFPHSEIIGSKLIRSSPTLIAAYYVLHRLCTPAHPFFFFSSRRRHTRLTCDWSSDVCSSDLTGGAHGERQREGARFPGRVEALVLRLGRHRAVTALAAEIGLGHVRRHGLRGRPRSEERRVGKECRSRWSPGHEKKKRRAGGWC